MDRLVVSTELGYRTVDGMILTGLIESATAGRLSELDLPYVSIGDTFETNNLMGSVTRTHADGMAIDRVRVANVRGVIGQALNMEPAFVDHTLHKRAVQGDADRAWGGGGCCLADGLTVDVCDCGDLRSRASDDDFVSGL